MTSLLEIQAAADTLSKEERAGLAAHLLASLPAAPSGADDAEIDQREIEMDSGAVATLTHEEFLAAVGRK